MKGDVKADKTDDVSLMFFRSIVAFDHAKQVIKIISLVFTDEAGSNDDIEKLFGAANQKNKRIKDALNFGEFHLPKNGEKYVNGQTVSNWKREDFESAVTEIKELINAGECYQVVLSQCFTRETNATPVSMGANEKCGWKAAVHRSRPRRG